MERVARSGYTFSGQRLWSSFEDSFLVNNIWCLKYSELAEILGRTNVSVGLRCRALGIGCKHKFGNNGKGRTINGHGYAYLFFREDDGVVMRFEHVVMAEKALGKPLPKGAVVHHVDGNRANNSPNNLVICQDQRYHLLLHTRAKVVSAGKVFGVDFYCSRCNSWKLVDDFTATARKRFNSGGAIGLCKSCCNSRQIDAYRSK